MSNEIGLIIMVYLQVIAPWRLEEFTSRFQGRPDLLKYAAQNNIPVSVTPKDPWSMDANLMHISYESGILENPSNEPRESMFQMTKSVKVALDSSLRLEIEFKKGLPISVNHDGTIYGNPVKILSFLNKVGGENGVGRIDIVENRFIGLKVNFFS